MNLFRNLVKALTRTRSVEPLTLSAQAWLRASDDDAPNPARLLAPYSQSAWIYVAVSLLAETVAHIPFRLSRGKGRNKTIVDSGPAYDLLQTPHPSMTRALFWQTIVSWHTLRGEFFIAPLDRAGQPLQLSPHNPLKPAQLLPLSPDYFTHLINGHHLVGWKYNAPKQAAPLPAQVLLPQEVIHSRNFNPYDFWRGLSPLTVAMLPAVGDYAAEQFMKGLMLNNGDSGLIVTTEEMIDETQREQFLAALNDRKRRAGTADRPLFLWGKAKVEKATISSADLQFLENRKLNRQEIGAIFKVPESMMGFTGQKNVLSGGTAIEQDRLNFVESTISALCHQLETAIEPLIKSFDPTLDAWFDLDSLPIMQAARRERMLTAQKAFAMGVPFNEINHAYDLGFEALPWGNKGYLPASIIEVGAMSDDGTESSSQTDPSILRMLQLLETVDTIPSAPAQDTAASDPVKSKTGKLRKFFFEQRGRVLERLANPGHDQPLFDLSRENDLLLERMEVTSEAEQGRAASLMEINQSTFDAIEALRGASDLSEQVKKIFNKITSRCNLWTE